MKLQRKKERQSDVAEKRYRREQHGILGTDIERKKERERERQEDVGWLWGNIGRQADWTDWFSILSLSRHLSDLILSL